MSTAFDPFPTPYRLFFTVVEPAVTLGGVIYAVFSPLKYHQNLVPPTTAPIPLDVHPASIMAVRQLGSCFFLFALLATLLLRQVDSSLRSHPILLEKIVKSYLICLAIADCTHISFTFYDIGLAGTLDYKNWNTLVMGNCVITGGLFLVRSLWFAGVARGSAGSSDERRKQG